MLDLVFPESCKKSVNLQCVGDETSYREPTFFTSQLCEICNSVRPKKILDLGCGIGRGSMFLFKTLGLKDTKFYLLDGDSVSNKIDGLSNRTNDFYNSQTATIDFCVANGLLNYEFINAQKLVWPPDTKFDFVFSVAAIGFHWPISLYLNELSTHVDKGTLLAFQSRSIFDPRQNAILVTWNANQIKSVKESGQYKLVKFVDDSDSSLILIEKT